MVAVTPSDGPRHVRAKMGMGTDDHLVTWRSLNVYSVIVYVNLGADPMHRRKLRRSVTAGMVALP